MSLSKQQRIENLKKGKQWELWEIDYLEKHYQYKGNKEIGDFIERTKDAVSSKLHALKLIRTNSKYLSMIRNMREGSIQRKRLYKDMTKKFGPPAKEPMSEFAEKLYQKFIERRKKEDAERQGNTDNGWDWQSWKRDSKPIVRISSPKRCEDLFQGRAETVGAEASC